MPCNENFTAADDGQSGEGTAGSQLSVLRLGNCKATELRVWVQKVICYRSFVQDKNIAWCENGTCKRNQLPLPLREV